MQRSPVSSPVAASCLLLIALAQTHCGGEESASPPTALGPTSELSATEAIASGVVARRFPDDGIRIEVDGDVLTVFARDVARFDVLHRLASRFRFELDDWSPEDPIVDVFVENVALEVALARLIEPTPYRLSYERANDSEVNVVWHLEVGTPPDGSKARRGASGDDSGVDGAEGPRATRRYRRATAAATRVALEARELRQESRRQEALVAAASEDEATRLDAVEYGLSAADSESRDRLLELALDDPSPRVRDAAIKELSFGDAPLGLVRALDDPEPSLVISAIEALSWLRDPEAREAIATKLDDPNPDIAAAARNGMIDSRAPE